MERRLAISQKRFQSRYENSEVGGYTPSQQNLNAGEGGEIPPGPSSRPHSQSYAFAMANSERPPRSRSSSNDQLGASGSSTRSRRRMPSNSGTPVPPEVPLEAHTPLMQSPQLATPLDSSSLGTPIPAKRSSKRKSVNETTPNNSITKPESASKKKKSKQTELRTRVEYLGLNLPLHKLPRRMKSADFSTQTSVSSDVGSKLGGVQGEGGVAGGEGDALGSQSTSSCSASSVQGSETGQNGLGEEMIIVPSWRTLAGQIKEEVGQGEENSSGMEVSLVVVWGREREKDWLMSLFSSEL